MRRSLLIAAALLAGCAEAPPVPSKAPEPAARAEPAGIVVQVSQTGQPARDLMHRLAAECWLDGVVRGAQLIVKPDGNLVIVGETQDLVAANYVGLKGTSSRWRLTGTAVSDPALSRRLVQTVDRANRTGETACPIATG